MLRVTDIAGDEAPRNIKSQIVNRGLWAARRRSLIFETRGRENDEKVSIRISRKSSLSLKLLMVLIGIIMMIETVTMDQHRISMGYAFGYVA